MDFINWKEEVRRLLDRIDDDKVLRRIWKILMEALGYKL